MDTTINRAEQSSVWEWEPSSDVWWGPDGIDALLWADGTPYVEPSGDGEPTAPVVLEIER